MTTHEFPGMPDKNVAEPEPWRKTNGGYPLDEVVSSLQKMIRRGAEEPALYWAFEMHESSYGRYLWRRLCIIAAEDIGFGDVQTVILVGTLASMWEKTIRKGAMGDTNIVTMAVLAMCRAAKNREVDFAKGVTEEMKKRVRLEVPEIAVDGHTKRGRARDDLKDVDFEMIYWVQEGQRTVPTVGVNRYIDKWVELYGIAYRYKAETIAETIRLLHEQYPDAGEQA